MEKGWAIFSNPLCLVSFGTYFRSKKSLLTGICHEYALELVNILRWNLKGTSNMSWNQMLIEILWNLMYSFWYCINEQESMRFFHCFLVLMIKLFQIDCRESLVPLSRFTHSAFSPTALKMPIPTIFVLFHACFILKNSIFFTVCKKKNLKQNTSLPHTLKKHIKEWKHSKIYDTVQSLWVNN